jgi:hypothetical protein
VTRFLGLLLLVAGLCSWPASAAAAPGCGRAGRPWVSVAFDPAGFSPPFAERVLSDLRAGLANRGIDACPPGEGVGDPLASVKIASTTGPSVAVALEIRDAVTEKRVMRDVDLARVPEDGRAFAIAIAVDELVWASWAEIALAKRGPKKKPRRAPPPEVVRGVEHDLPERDEPATRLGARGALEHFGGGQTHLGADATALFPFTERVGLELTLGLRQGRRVEAPHGHVLSSAAGLGAMLRITLLRALPLELSLFAGPRAGLARFTGRALPESRGTELSGLVLFLRGGVLAGVRVLGPLWVEANGGAGAPLRGLEAQDAGRVVSGVSGLELFGAVALMVEL